MGLRARQPGGRNTARRAACTTRTTRSSSAGSPTLGAGVMGRKMFSGGSGPWEDDPNADGWWGDEPPFRVPVFVVTHHEREPKRVSERHGVHVRHRRRRIGDRAGARRRRAARTCASAAARASRRRPCARVSSTGSTSTSRRFCSAGARGSSRALTRHSSSSLTRPSSPNVTHVTLRGLSHYRVSRATARDAAPASPRIGHTFRPRWRRLK